ncbi:hypothetical protein CDAR_535401 [Caerostris darwini]|uniref:Uncharacterized protein n=1 Tax=Caerostris darwini TaxID=1538125 RepID=A0AAV4V2Q9_9ARAC|nr:hypothetical protein CDAR_535401 [Caerostris darwini]
MSCQIIKLAALPRSFPAAVFEAKSFKITESSLRNNKATFDTHASRNLEFRLEGCCENISKQAFHPVPEKNGENHRSLSALDRRLTRTY